MSDGFGALLKGIFGDEPVQGGSEPWTHRLNPYCEVCELTEEEGWYEHEHKWLTVENLTERTTTTYAEPVTPPQ